MSVPSGARKLMDLVEGPGLFDTPRADLAEMQLEAAQELFEERRGQLAVLDERARDEQVDQIKRVEDIVPLLFAHTTYKSYPESFIQKGQWDRLTAWYQTLAAVPVSDVDLAGIGGIDDWVDQMAAAGHFIHASSGTTGKCSFLNNTADDLYFCGRQVRNYLGWPKPVTPDRSRRYYQLYPRSAPQKPAAWYAATAEYFGRPDAQCYLTDEPIRISYLNRVGAMRKAMSEGRATPSDIAAFDLEMTEREARMHRQVEALADDLWEHRDDPICIAGISTMLFEAVQYLRSKGCPDGQFRDAYIGNKPRARKHLAQLAPGVDAAREMVRFFGNAHQGLMYGMTELSTYTIGCESERYHVPPWMILLLVDRGGERLLNTSDGVVDGRAAFLDLSLEGRWGGIVAGDHIQVDFSDRCTCGRPGPVILDTVERYSDLEGDDKINCAGSFDAYVRGVMESQ